MERLRKARIQLELMAEELDRLKPILVKLLLFTIFLFGLGRIIVLVFWPK